MNKIIPVLLACMVLLVTSCDTVLEAFNSSLKGGVDVTLDIALDGVALSSDAPLVFVAVPFSWSDGYGYYKIDEDTGWQQYSFDSTSSSGTLTASIMLPAVGYYQLYLFHDADNDGELDATDGVPTENSLYLGKQYCIDGEVADLPISQTLSSTSYVSALDWKRVDDPVYGEASDGTSFNMNASDCYISADYYGYGVRAQILDYEGNVVASTDSTISWDGWIYSNYFSSIAYSEGGMTLLMTIDADNDSVYGNSGDLVSEIPFYLYSSDYYYKDLSISSSDFTTVQ